jgi:photosystem II stability/assembly factor-like uncharacterized protein
VLGFFNHLYPIATAQYQWRNLEDVFWVSGADVACGFNHSSQTANRYLIAHNTGDSLYRWQPGDSRWWLWDALPSANKIISFKVVDLFADYGNIAFCSAYNDRIYRTLNGGVNWLEVQNSQNLPNKHFTSIEVPNSINIVGDVVMVACSAVEDQPSTFYTANGGTSWASIGGTSSVGMQVNDIESFPEAILPPVMAIGTSDGIYQKTELGEEWDEPWDGPVAFDNYNVPVLESADLEGDLAQFAAVQNNTQQATCNIYYTETPDMWPSYEEIRPEGESFGHMVHDMAAISWQTGFSLYAATPEGLYLIYFTDPNSVQTYQFVDVKTIANAGGYYPMKSDSNIIAVDYSAKTVQGITTATILAAMALNIYEITEVRDEDGTLVDDIQIADAVDGTYPLNAVAATLPVNSQNDQKAFVLSNNGLIKEKHLESPWTFVSKAFLGDSPDRIGTDIAAELDGEAPYVLAASKEGAGGTIMYSDDGGISWTDQSPDNDPVINALDLDHNYDTDNAYSAGSGSYVWKSTDNGLSWGTQPVPSSTDFTDICFDPDPNRDEYAYACGYYGISTPRMFLYDGSSWSSISSGLSGTRVNQIAKGNSANWVNPINWLYAVTDMGVYKASLNATPMTWTVRTNGIGTQNLGSIAADKRDQLCFLVSTAPGVTPPQVWATGDSGRSWIELPLGDIPENASINRLGTSEGISEGFLAATTKGVYYLGDIFKKGSYENETWGPGAVVVNGDVSVHHNSSLRPGQNLGSFPQIQTLLPLQ